MNKYYLIVVLFFFLSCEGESTDFYPKPNGYLRLDFPERIYSSYESDCPFSFQIPDYFSVVEKDSICNKKDLNMERFNATLNLTYLPVDTSLNQLIEKSRSLAYEHAIFADAIEEELVINNEEKIYGLKYKISGDAASPYQFYLTDSVNHFMRGALYFNVSPNYDSVKTSLDYIVYDLDNMIETLHWKK